MYMLQCIYIHIDTHTYTYMYIYIYILYIVPLYVVCLVTGLPCSSIILSALPWSAVMSRTQPAASQAAFISPIALSGARSREGGREGEGRGGEARRREERVEGRGGEGRGGERRAKGGREEERRERGEEENIEGRERGERERERGREREGERRERGKEEYLQGNEIVLFKKRQYKKKTKIKPQKRSLLH